MQTLIDLIIGEIEDSTVNRRENAKGNRNINIQQEHLDAVGKQNLLQQAEELESMGLIQCEPKSINGRPDIYTVNYSLCNVREIYRISGKIPKSDRIKEIKKAVEEQVKKIPQAKASEHECGDMGKIFKIWLRAGTIEAGKAERHA